MEKIEIPFFDFNFQNSQIQNKLFDSFNEFFKSNQYILGKKVIEFEREYSIFNNTKYCVGVGNGLDALVICLKALNIGKGDEVIVPSNTYIATWLAVSMVGATIVPVEPEIDSFNISPKNILEKISKKTKAIIPVHLFGNPCKMDEILEISRIYNLHIIEDNAQSQGANFKGKLTGSFGICNATSFYPGKNLGALGDGGAITTNELNIYENAKILRNYGSEFKYYNIKKGLNSRLDEIQSYFLLVKMPFLNSWNYLRLQTANRYINNLLNCKSIALPFIEENSISVFHQFVIKSRYRDELSLFLKNNGIGTMIHYPVAPFDQKAYSEFYKFRKEYPIAIDLANTSLSLPIYPGISYEQVDYISNKICDFDKLKKGSNFF